MTRPRFNNVVCLLVIASLVAALLVCLSGLDDMDEPPVLCDFCRQRRPSVELLNRVNGRVLRMCAGCAEGRELKP